MAGKSKAKREEGSKACPYPATHFMTPAIRHVLHVFSLKNVRKMCTVVQSWQGDPLAASPLHPLGLWCSKGIEPFSHQ